MRQSQLQALRKLQNTITGDEAAHIANREMGYVREKLIVSQ
jgi:hypothetical protein